MRKLAVLLIMAMLSMTAVMAHETEVQTNGVAIPVLAPANESAQVDSEAAKTVECTKDKNADCQCEECAKAKEAPVDENADTKKTETEE